MPVKMRILLLLSAFLTAFAGLGASARAAAVPAHQARVLVAAVLARADAASAAQRPVAALPSRVALVRPTGFVAAAPKVSVPLYAARRRV